MRELRKISDESEIRAAQSLVIMPCFPIIFFFSEAHVFPNFDHMIEHRKNCEDEVKKLKMLIENSEKKKDCIMMYVLNYDLCSKFLSPLQAIISNIEPCFFRSQRERNLINDARNRVAYLEKVSSFHRQ